MKKSISIILLTLVAHSVAFSWGKTGHRIVGQIAYEHLNSKAKKSIEAILGNEELGMVGNYMDFVRADPSKDYMTPWHYCTVPEGKTYEELEVPKQGDAIQAIERLINELKSKQFTYESEVENLKYLVHLVADIHQPLHVGNGEDMGGNKVKVEFMWEKSNLHRVWDSGMIDYQQLSYTEYTKWINHATKEQVASWQCDHFMVWVDEAMSYREAMYDLPEGGKINYDYNYANIAIVNERLLKAGIRLAGILNAIYG